MTQMGDDMDEWMQVNCSFNNTSLSPFSFNIILLF